MKLSLLSWLAILCSCIVVLIYNKPCIVHTYLGENENLCKEFIGGGGCGFSPTLSSLLCGKTCGFCPSRSHREIQESVKKNWKPIARIHYNDLSYDYFVEHHKIPGIFH
jgi:hypothetical protein